MPAPSDLVHQTTTSTGTGNLTLTAVSGKRTFALAYPGGTSNECDYYVSNRDAAEWERGTGHVTGGALVRDTVLASSNSGSAVSFSAGTKDVTNDVPAANQVYNENSTVTDGHAILFDGTTGRKLKTAGATPSLNGTSEAHTAGTIELGHATDTTLSRSAAGVLAVEGVIVKNVGKETIWIPASAMISRTTNGASVGTVEQTTNKNMFKTLDFDTTTQEFAQFEVHFPKSWGLGTVTFQPVMSHASGSGNIVWGLAGVARSDDDVGDVAFGTAQTSDKTIGTANDIYIGPESSAITIAGTPAAGDTVQFQINRTVASDTLGVDARLHGIRLFFTTNAATDA
jgi:hypothetical protein